MIRTVQEIAEAIGGRVFGDASTSLAGVASLRSAGPQDLTYADEKFYPEIARSQAGCVIVGQNAEVPGRTMIAVRHAKLGFARAAALLLAPTETSHQIHPTAVVAATATIGKNVKVGPGAVIEAGAVIGDNSVIEASVYIGPDASIGNECIIYPNAVIYPDVHVGHRAVIHAGAVIGADGFGFVRDGSVYVKFPQVGQVRIGDDVEVGANTCIDRGSLETTIIRDGVKLDNLVQVAHNVEIGEHTVIAAQTGISGSCTIGAGSIIGGQVGMGERARLDPGTIIGGQGGVLNAKHVRAGDVLWGTPVRPLKEFLSQQAELNRLPRLRDEVRRMREELDSLHARLKSLSAETESQ